jgi:hypothetical protein
LPGHDENAPSAEPRETEDETETPTDPRPPRPRPSTADESLRTTALAVGLTVAAGFGVADFVLALAEGLPRWLGVTIALAVGFIIALVVLWGRSVIKAPTVRRGGIVLVVGLLLVTAVATRPWESFYGRGSCPSPVELPVVVPYDGDAEFTRILDRYTESQVDSGGCRTVSVTTFSAPWIPLREALASGWGHDAVREFGPPPAVWIAESSTQIRSVISAEDESSLIGMQRTFGHTPLVLAVPNSEKFDADVNRTGRALRPSLLLEDYLREPDRAAVRSDPTVSFTGALHLHSLYNFDRDTSIDAHAVEKHLAWGIEDAALAPGSDTDLWCQLREVSAQPATAVLTTERAVYAHNSNRPLGANCTADGADADRYRALYPQQALSLDFTAVRLNWDERTWGSAAAAIEAHRDEAAASLITWIASDAAKSEINDAGIRPGPHVEASQPDPPITPANLLDPNVQPEQTTLLPQNYDANMRTYQESRRDTRVILAVDVSGSMAQATGVNGKRRFDLAVTGLNTSLRRLGPSDHFGLWTFPGDDGPYSVLLPVEADAAPRARQSRAVEILSAQEPSGQTTPLHQTIAAGVDALATSADDETQSVLVVLTDGLDTEDGPDLADVGAIASNAKIRIHVIAIGEASCTASPVGELAAATQGACTEVDLGSLDATFDTLFLQIWGGNE